MIEAVITVGPIETLGTATNSELHFPIRLAANRNLYGPSARATAAMQAAAREEEADFERDTDLLRDRIAREHRLTRNTVVVAAGSARILRMAVSALPTRGKQLITAGPTFDAINRYATRMNREL